MAGGTEENVNGVTNTMNTVVDNNTCPITLELFEDPVLCTGDGQTYERSAILRHLERSTISPVTREDLVGAQIVPNYHARRSADSLRHGPAPEGRSIETHVIRQAREAGEFEGSDDSHTDSGLDNLDEDEVAISTSLLRSRVSRFENVERRDLLTRLYNSEDGGTNTNTGFTEEEVEHLYRRLLRLSGMTGTDPSERRHVQIAPGVSAETLLERIDFTKAAGNSGAGNEQIMMMELYFLQVAPGISINWLRKRVFLSQPAELTLLKAAKRYIRFNNYKRYRNGRSEDAEDFGMDVPESMESLFVGNNHNHLGPGFLGAWFGLALPGFMVDWNAREVRIHDATRQYLEQAREQWSTDVGLLKREGYIPGESSGDHRFWNIENRKALFEAAHRIESHNEECRRLLDVLRLKTREEKRYHL